MFFRTFCAHVLAHALERDGEVGALDLAQHQLHGPVVERGDVLEDEHLRADQLGELGVPLGRDPRGSSARSPGRTG